MLSVLQGCIFMLTDRSNGQAAPAVSFLSNGRVLRHSGLPVAGRGPFVRRLSPHAALRSSAAISSPWATMPRARARRASSLRTDPRRRPPLLRTGARAWPGPVAGRAGHRPFQTPETGWNSTRSSPSWLGGTPSQGRPRQRGRHIGCGFCFLGVLGNILNLMQVPGLQPRSS